MASCILSTHPERILAEQVNDGDKKLRVLAAIRARLSPNPAPYPMADVVILQVSGSRSA